MHVEEPHEATDGQGQRSARIAAGSTREKKKKKWEICVGMRNKLWCIVLSALYLQNDQLGLQVCGRSLCRRALC